MPARRRQSTSRSRPKSDQLEMGMRSAVTQLKKSRRASLDPPGIEASGATKEVSGGMANCGWLSSMTAKSDVPERGQPTTTGNGLRGAARGLGDSTTRGDSKTILLAIMDVSGEF